MFSHDPKSGEKLSKVALEEIEQLINDNAVRKTANRERSRTKVHPRTQRRNSFWVSYIDAMYVSTLPVLNGDIDKMYENTEQIRADVLETLTTPFPNIWRTLAVKRRVNVVLIPQRPLFLRLIAPNMDDIKGFLMAGDFWRSLRKLALLDASRALKALTKGEKDKK